MYEATGFEHSRNTRLPALRKADRGTRVRNAIARKKIERRIDRERLRKDLEEIWK
jgi:hypothetical protein